MTNTFSLLFVNDNPKKQPFVNKRLKQKVVWYEIKNAVDPLTNEDYGHCKYKILYIDDKHWSSCLIAMNNSLIGDTKTGERFHKLLINYLDDQKFNSIFNLA